MELWTLRMMILLISFIHVGQAQENKPVLTVQPNASQIFRGENVTLSCIISGGSEQYIWYKDGVHVHRSAEKDYTIKVDQSHRYRCYGSKNGQTTTLSDEVTLSVIERPKAVVILQPDGEIFSGQIVTLTCEIRGHADTVDVEWMYNWYKDGVLLFAPVEHKDYSFTAVKSFSGKFSCRGQTKSDSQTSETSPAVTLTVSGSLIIRPSRTQHFTADSLTLSCEDLSDSTGWTVRGYSYTETFVYCLSVSGSTCKLSTSHTGVYWCQSASGGRSNSVNITVHNGAVILDSPVHPVTEGHNLTLRCLFRNKKIPGSGVDFYKDDSILHSQTTGEMTISSVSKSDEGFYHCKHPERGESPKSWVSVEGRSHVGASMSVLKLISSLVTVSVYLLLTIVLAVKCFRARVQTDEDTQNAVIEE